jgi:hypothetical protein
VLLVWKAIRRIKMHESVTKCHGLNWLQFVTDWKRSNHSSFFYVAPVKEVQPIHDACSSIHLTSSSSLTS